MIYFLYGLDQYRLSQKLKGIIARYREAHQGSMNLVEMEAEETSFAALMDIYRQSSMFIKRRLVIFKNPFQTKVSFQKQLREKMAELQASEILFVFYEERRVNRQSALFKEFKRQAFTQEFSLLRREALLTWIDEEAKNYSLMLSPEVRIRLAELAKDSLWEGHLALEKIAAYLGPQEKKVDLTTLEKVTDSHPALGPYAVTNALQSCQIGKALEEANKFLDRQKDGSALVGQLNSLLSHTLTIRYLLDQGKNIYEIKREVKFNPWVVNHLLLLAKRLTSEYLKEKISDLFTADRNIKTSRLSPREAINAFLLSFASIDSTKC